MLETEKSLRKHHYEVPPDTLVPLSTCATCVTNELDDDYLPKPHPWPCDVAKALELLDQVRERRDQ